MEGFQKFGPNVVGFQLLTGEWQWYIVGCYLFPDDTSTIKSFVAAFKELPLGAKLLVAGDLNVNLADPEGDRMDEEIAAALTKTGLEDMLTQFLLQRRP